MSKATKKLLITASATVFLMASTSTAAFAAPVNPGYYVGNQKYLLSDIAANPSLLVQLNNNLNTKGISSFIADLPEGRLHYAAFIAANPGKLDLTAFKSFAAAHPAVIPSDAVIVRPDGTEQRDPDSPLPGVSVQNGLITVSFSSAPSVTPTIKDFVVTQSVYGGSNPKVIVPSGLQLNTEGTVVSLSVPTIAATDLAQSIVYTVTYRLSDAVSAGFTLAAKPAGPSEQATITSASAVNGSITVNFDKSVSVSEATYGMKIKRSINSGAASTEVPSHIQASGSTVTFTVGEVQSAAADQSVVYSLSYLNGTTIHTTSFTVDRIPVVLVDTVSAVNGSVTVKFAAGVTVSEATYQNFQFKQSINDAPATAITAAAPVLNTVNNTVTYTVPIIQKLYTEQTVTYSVYNGGNSAIGKGSFTTGILNKPTVNNFVIYNNNKSTVSGAGEPDFNVNIEITDTDSSGTHKVNINGIPVDNTGRYSTFIDQSKVSGLKDGPVHIIATQIDPSGRVADQKSNEVSGSKEAYIIP